MLTEHDRTRLEQIDDDIENERAAEYTQADMIWMRCLLQDAEAALAESRRDNQTLVHDVTEWRERYRAVLAERDEEPQP